MVPAMFDDEPLAPRALAVLMPMTAQPESALKWGIISYVGSFAEGTWLDGPELARLTGIAWARRHLADLVETRVLDCDDGGGGNQRWYRVNPRWWQWKASARVGQRKAAGVVWTHRCAEHETAPPASLGACHACRLMVEDLLRLHDEKQRHDPIDLFINRAPRRAFARINARLGARYSEDQVAIKALEAAKSRATAREIAQSGANPEGISRAMARDFSGPLEEEERSPSGTDRSTPPPTELDDPPDYGRARRALFAIAVAGRGRQRPGLWGSKRNRVKQLITEHGAEAFEAACGLLEAHVHPVPVLVDQLADLLSSGLDLTVASDEILTTKGVGSPAGFGFGGGEWYPPTAMVRLRTVRDLIATYEADTNSAGECTPVPAELLAERDALLAELMPEGETACVG